jgi:histone-lysine N-methyltransferase SETD2
MGGKTQTDAAFLLPDGISEALGVTHQMERQWLKENKHLLSKQQKDDSIINEAFVKSIEVTPIEDSEV